MHAMIRLRRLRIAAALPLLGALALGGSAAADEIYRWVDAQGNVHFGSAPPPGARQLQVANPEKGRGSLVIAPRSTAQPAVPPARAASPAAQQRLGASGQWSSGEDEAASGGEAPVVPEQPGGRSEESWRSEGRRYHEALEARRRSLESLEESERRAFQRSARATDYDAIDRAKAALRSAEDPLNDFEQRAREAEVPPSWLD
jgi:hypothetical protein